MVTIILTILGTLAFKCRAIVHVLLLYPRKLTLSSFISQLRILTKKCQSHGLAESEELCLLSLYRQCGTKIRSSLAYGPYRE